MTAGTNSQSPPLHLRPTPVFNAPVGQVATHSPHSVQSTELILPPLAELISMW